MKALRRVPEGVIVAVYLMTSPQSNMLGLFSQPILYMAHETGLGLEGASKGLRHCVEVGFCSYDEDSEFVWVHEMAKYQIANEIKASDNRCKGIQKDYDALPENPFLGAFFDRYCEAFHLTNRRGSGAPSKPLRSQEQEQEKEQEQEQEKRESRSQATRPPSRPKSEAITLTTYLANCKAAGQKPVPDGHAIRRWCADAGIVPEMLQIAWVLFRERYTEGEKGKLKRYKDWPGHFATAVKDNWAGLWFMGDDGQPAWTSKGLTHKAVLDARLGQKETAHG